MGCLDGHRAVGYRVKRDPAERQGRPADPENRPARILANYRAEIKPFEVTRLNLVQNWFEELKRLCPTGK